MLFWIEGEVGSVVADMSDADSRTAVINIVSAVRAGLHVLGGSRTYLRELITTGGFGPDICAAIESSEQQLSQDGSLLADLPKVRVSTSFDRASALEKDWLVPLQFFARSETCERAKLLVENPTDYEIYRAFALKVIGDRFSSLALSLQPLNGGGDTTADVLDQERRHGIARLLCIVDSDRDCPSENPKQTARRCRTVFTSIEEKWMYDLVVLDCRELENLIPQAMRSAACEQLSPDQKMLVESLSAMPPPALAHICLKKGDRLCRFYINGTIASRPTKDGCHCIHCGLASGCATTPILGEKFLKRVADGIVCGRLAICDEFHWTTELKVVIAKVLATGLSRPVSRAA